MWGGRLWGWRKENEDGPAPERALAGIKRAGRGRTEATGESDERAVRCGTQSESLGSGGGREALDGGGAGGGIEERGWGGQAGQALQCGRPGGAVDCRWGRTQADLHERATGAHPRGSAAAARSKRGPDSDVVADDAAQGLTGEGPARDRGGNDP